MMISQSLELSNEAKIGVDMLQQALEGKVEDTEEAKELFMDAFIRMERSRERKFNLLLESRADQWQVRDFWICLSLSGAIVPPVKSDNNLLATIT